MAKDNGNKLMTVIRTFGPLLILILTVAATAAVNVYRIEENGKAITVNSADIAKSIEERHQHDIARVEMKIDIKYIKEAADERKTDFKNLTTLIEQALKEVRQ